MGMLKGDSTALNFDQLMAQATQVAKQQDASLMERARQKRREDDERRRREERALREREETQAQLAKKRELQDKKQKQLMDQKKQNKGQEKRRAQPDKSTKMRTSNTFGNAKSSAVGRKNVAMANLFSEKKKPVDMSFDDLMKKAREQSVGKGGSKDKTTTLPAPPPPPPRKQGSYDSRAHFGNDNNTPTIYNRIKKPEPTKSSPANLEGGLSARERARQLVSEPPKKVNTQKRDRRSIADVQREIRRSKGIRSDDEEDRPRDSRLIGRGNVGKSNSRLPPSSSSSSSLMIPPRKRPLSPPPRPTTKRPLPATDRRLPPPSPAVRRMPFSGRPLDSATRKLNTPPRKRYREEEDEQDEELASFIVDDDDDDPRYSRGPRRNSYSDEISKIFRYDRNRYINDPAYSDDDMEADAGDVLREEKRSERIGRREDLLEEQKELERLKKRKKN
ncbi:SPT2 chromatin protein-domain-containing protein [Parasitella parasitica]|nr:SPT2 chromatin protein-domain-containing protein [Parasitella parasitica]